MFAEDGLLIVTHDETREVAVQIVPLDIEFTYSPEAARKLAREALEHREITFFNVVPPPDSAAAGSVLAEPKNMTLHMSEAEAVAFSNSLLAAAAHIEGLA